MNKLFLGVKKFYETWKSAILVCSVFLVVFLVVWILFFRGCDCCLIQKYAEINYHTCCAGGGYKLEGRQPVCEAAAYNVKGPPLRKDKTKEESTAFLSAPFEAAETSVSTNIDTTGDRKGWRKVEKGWRKVEKAVPAG